MTPRPGKERTEGGMKRASEYRSSGVNLEGERLEAIDEILGEEVILMAYTFLPSCGYEGQDEFVVMQVKRPEEHDELRTVSTGAKAILDTVHEIPTEDLPVAMKIVRKTGQKTGRKYLAIE